MKRLGRIWEDIISVDNLYLAFKKASKRKHHLNSVRNIEDNLDKYIYELHSMLCRREFTTSKYKQYCIYEPKKRVISSLPFYPDRIVQHAVLNILCEYWDRLMIFDSYSCRKNKGQHRGSNRCKQYVREYKYVLHCDISKFYDSLNHNILKSILRNKIKDIYVLNILDDIIDSVKVNLRGQFGVGVPIGSLLSQWFGNLYMNELDMYIKHHLKCIPYIRYCDDFLLFSNEKKELNEYLVKITCFITKLELKFSKARIYPVTHGVDFLGYRHFRGYTLIRKSTVKRMKLRIKKILSFPEDFSARRLKKVQGQVSSMNGWLRHANSYNLKRALSFDKIWEKYHEKIS